MKELLDSARSVVRERYALLSPASAQPSALPGWEKALCQVMVSPALGARFSQLLITLQSDSLGQGNTGRNEYFVYLLEGNASILLDDRRHRLEAGSYAFVPPGKDMQIKGSSSAARLLIFQKPYHPLSGTVVPPVLVSHERDSKGQALPAAQNVRVQALLPAQAEFDLAVNLLTFQPGAALPTVAAPATERGFLLLRGQGLFRLGGDWHPVEAGDVIWTASYCPQWFVAVGSTPATYVCCEDANRDPI